MKREDYYRALADKIVFNGLADKKIGEFASYKAGKDFGDLTAAVSGATKKVLGRGAENIFDGVTVAISGVLDVDTREHLKEFKIRLKSFY